MRAFGSDTLKPYTGSLPGRTDIKALLCCLASPGSKPLVSLPGLLSPSEREPGPMIASPSRRACARSHAA